MRDNFMTGAIIAIGAIIVAFCAYFVSKVPDSPVEQAAEAVADYELGLPQGTIDITPEEGKRK